MSVFAIVRGARHRLCGVHAQRCCRVRYYEDRIKLGYRPAPLLFNGILPTFTQDVSCSDYHDQSDTFVLDGHHKLMAYNELRIWPPFVLISRRYRSVDELRFTRADYERELAPRLSQHNAATFEHPDHWGM